MFVITGGGSGIGQALALALASRQKSVLIVGRRESFLKETAAVSPHIEYLRADVTTQDGLESINHYFRSIPYIDGLINNAGVLEPILSLKEIRPETWQHVFETNVQAPLFLTQKLYNKLTHGRVLNIGSGAAYFPIKGWAPYCSSKAALAMLTRCWQLESEGVAFASVMPGIIDTQMQAAARSSLNMDADQVAFYQRLKDHGRLISADTVAAFLTWLLLDVDKHVYSAQEWDIYETSHHKAWLRPPHEVLHWNF